MRAPYHAMHHIYPDSYLSSYTTLFDGLMGTACQVRGRRVALTGASGSFGSAIKDLLENAGASVTPLRFGVDWTYEDYSGAQAVLESADILVLAHGAKGEQAMAANCDSFLALFDQFKSLTGHRQVPAEVWAVGSEIECHPAFGHPGLRSYARSKRAFARTAATFMRDRHVLYRHIVPSAFCSPMGPGLMTGRTAAAIAFWLIRRGFRYVPVTYTGIAFLNFIPFVLRGLRAVRTGRELSRLARRDQQRCASCLRIGAQFSVYSCSTVRCSLSAWTSFWLTIVVACSIVIQIPSRADGVRSIETVSLHFRARLERRVLRDSLRAVVPVGLAIR